MSDMRLPISKPRDEGARNESPARNENSERIVFAHQQGVHVALTIHGLVIVPLTKKEALAAITSLSEVLRKMQ